MFTVESSLFSLTETQFEPLAIRVFAYQYTHVPVYQSFCNAFNKNPDNVLKLTDIPFLPIRFFKTHDVISNECSAETIFYSSGTTGQQPSRHAVASLEIYQKSFMQCFEFVYGAVSQYAVLALLPSYLERSGSSLVYMAEYMIQKSGHSSSGLYLYEHQKLAETLSILGAQKQKTILLGVSYALLDFAEFHPCKFPELIVMETGGMKGRRTELHKAELHEKLMYGFGVPTIHAEYGMTELLSQAYSTGDGLYKPPPTMRVFFRDVYNPMQLLPEGDRGAINIIDLANVYSCSFIATDDTGVALQGGNFELHGRMDHSELRGCNLLLS